jgi:hypothetical protein
LFKNSGTGVTERVEKPRSRRINGYVDMKYLSKNEECVTFSGKRKKGGNDNNK